MNSAIILELLCQLSVIQTGFFSLCAESSVNESLRLSSVSMNIRVVQEDFCLRLDAQNSISLRKDDIIALYPQSTHLDPEIYEQPQVILTAL